MQLAGRFFVDAFLNACVAAEVALTLLCLGRVRDRRIQTVFAGILAALLLLLLGLNGALFNHLALLRYIVVREQGNPRLHVSKEFLLVSLLVRFLAYQGTLTRRHGALLCRLLQLNVQDELLAAQGTGEYWPWLFRRHIAVVARDRPPSVCPLQVVQL